ncbi:hypothetical protein Tco_0831940 [Tanacetum coccineum]
MSSKATSAKISISGEATSPDNHMSAVDQRLNIMSGGGSSSNKATLNESASAKELKSDSPLFLDELQVADQTKKLMPVEFGQPRAGTLKNLLLWARNRRNDLLFAKCGSIILGRRTAGTSQLVAGKSVRKELAERGDGGVTPASSSRVSRSELELGISDATAHVVVVMFDETASELVKCSADSLAQSDKEYLDDTLALPAPLENIIGATHTLEFKSHTYYEHGTFESFTCWNLISPEAVVESAGSSTIDVVPDTPRSSGKGLHKKPSMATLLKPCDGKTPISQELEDSDADSLPVQAGGKKKQCVS